MSLQPFVSDSEIQNADEPVVDLTAEERLLFTDKLGKDIRDVNFTPDFPRTGEIVSAMWARQYGVAVDGVIAIDPLFLQNMLAVTGGVAMPDGSTLDGTNTAQTLLHDVYCLLYTSTLRDVAEEAGVSLKTASNVINHSGRMTDSTREKVQEVIDRLGYRVNVSARNLNRGKTGFITLAVPTLTAPYLSRCV